VAKKLADIQKMVDAAAEPFYEYLTSTIEPEALNHLNTISSRTDVLIFSGIIRNYFLGLNEHRDIDIVLEKNVDIEKIFSDYKIKRNSFGGHKIFLPHVHIDIWSLAETWAIKKQPVHAFLSKGHIPYTAFFNFSAIVFSLHDKKFYYTKDFLRFLRDKQIDVVYQPNANYDLCVVNSIYYSEKYSLRLSPHLMGFLYYLHDKSKKAYEDVELKHFGHVLYSNEEISDRVKKFRPYKSKYRIKSFSKNLTLK
jgi:hypothetical protein